MKNFIKFNLVLALTLITFIFNVQGVYANNGNTIRIGLESRHLNSQTVPITNGSILFGYSNGQAFSPSTHIIAEEGFSFSVDNNYYLGTNERFNDYQSARNRANAINGGNNVKVAFLDNNSFSLYFGGYTTEAEAINALNENQEFSLVIPSSNKRVRLNDGENTVVIFDNASKHPQIIDGNGGFVTLGGRSYRGVMEIGRQLGTGITPVNIVDMEEYLYSVVPSEMPASWHIEALKAQAVAARSYSFASRGSHSHLGYELCDTIFSQVYVGVGNESARSTEAVQATKGLKAYHNGEIIMATYFSSSGGTTENSENVWVNSLPYLRGVEDTYESNGMVWERTFTTEEITKITNANGVNIGSVLNISIQETSEMGRVNHLLITGTDGTHSLHKEQIRTFFSPSTEGSLQSRNFEIVNGSINSNSNNNSANTYAVNQNVSIQYNHGTVQVPITSTFVLNSKGEIVHINDSDISIQGTGNNNSSSNSTTSTGNTITLSGKGWGHGVGMSQYGAFSMAEAGYTYQEILMHYYTGIEIR